MRFTLSDPGLSNLVQVVDRMGGRAQTEVARGLNESGDRVRTQVLRSLAQQTGAGYRAVRKATTTRRAKPVGGAFVGPGGLQYAITAKGGFIPLRDFGARRTAQGVVAAPWGQRKLFPHTFIATMKSGHEGVFTRIAGARRLPIRELWGPAIPNEMIKGKTAEAFDKGSASVLPAIMTRLGRVLAT